MSLVQDLFGAKIVLYILTLRTAFPLPNTVGQTLDLFVSCHDDASHLFSEPLIGLFQTLGL